jgi:putative queuosine salvage protein
MGLSDDVRRACAAIAADAEHVTIDLDRPLPEPGVAGLDPNLHRLDLPPADRARYVLILDAINFGSGWFDEIGADTNEITRHVEPWTDLLELSVTETAHRLQLPEGHELTRLYTRALNDLGAWLGDRDPLEVIDTGSAQAMAEQLLEMPLYDDPGFYKRAQITANDLVLAGVVEYSDIDTLTIFADNLVPHVLRHDGFLRYDVGPDLEYGSREEREIRACAVHACELIAREVGVPPRTLDNWLWNRGLTLPRGAHRTKTTAY